MEQLEERLAPSTNTTFVDDNWADLSRASGAPVIGDIIQNTNDTINAGGITAAYGVTGFGTVITNVPGTANGAAKINDAIANTSAGGTVNILEGTYSERADVNKALKLLGAQHGVDARTGRPGAAESVLDASGNSGQTLFNVTASDVTLDGFTVQNETSANQFGFGILLGAGTSGAHVLNNIVQNNIAGLSLSNSLATDQAVIQFNLFQNNNQPGPISGTAIYTDQFNAGGALTNVLIDSNAFTNDTNVGVLLGSTQAGSQSNITISNNTFSSDGNAVLVFNATSSSITGNTITGSVGSQIVIGGGVNGVHIANNFIQNGASRGIRVGDFGGGSTNQNVTVNDNSISGNATAGLEIDAAAGAYTGMLDATNNWWGSFTGPTTPANPGGTGDKIIDPNHQVIFIPFRNNGADAQPNTPGFQPSPNLPPAGAQGQANPALFPLGFGAGTNGVEAVVNLQANGQRVASPSPIPGWPGEIHRATGDLNGDGVSDTVWAAGAGGGPRVRIIAGGTGAVLADFFAFDPAFTLGVNVAVGDVNGDGHLDVIVAVAGVGGAPAVKVIDGTKLNLVQANGEIADSALLANFFAYDGNFSGGVTVAAADINGDGHADIITGAGPGGGPHVKVIDGTKLKQFKPTGEIADSALLASFFAFDPGFTGGVNVAAGDFNGDGHSDVIVGAGAGNIGPVVRVLDGTKLTSTQANGEINASSSFADFFAYASNFAGGVRVDAVDVNGDGKADIVTGAGPGGGPHVKVFRATDLALLDSFFATDATFTGGVFV